MTAMGDEESASPIASTRGAKIEDDTVDGKVATFLSMVPSWTPRKSDPETAVKAIEENLGVTEHKARDAAEIHARKPTAKMERLVSLMHSLALVSAAECGVVAMAAAAAVLCLRLSDRSQV
ncbi:hypothetical protein B296_00037156 [Ensete ventricosum]|uniref:Uncharacterized protein n=1 Tax=Ensete ventricosum TaxID=4639 RepID=A0A426YXA4_ENSVE|nr:hypothetical protein B296_00037156 [Ensete ventricosum]